MWTFELLRLLGFALWERPHEPLGATSLWSWWVIECDSGRIWRLLVRLDISSQVKYNPNTFPLRRVSNCELRYSIWCFVPGTGSLSLPLRIKIGQTSIQVWGKGGLYLRAFTGYLVLLHVYRDSRINFLLFLDQRRSRKPRFNSPPNSPTRGTRDREVAINFRVTSRLWYGFVLIGMFSLRVSGPIVFRGKIARSTAWRGGWAYFNSAGPWRDKRAYELVGTLVASKSAIIFL